jgi:hypothetical protein
MKRERKEMMKAVLMATTSGLRAKRGGLLRASLFSLLALQAVALPVLAAAAPLSNYRERVHEAMILIDSLNAFDAEEAEATEPESLAEVRRLLPETEQVEWNGTATVVNNGWLHQSLDGYERLGGGAEAREEALGKIAERLHALEGRLVETEAGSASAPRRDKDAEKGRLTNILSHPDYNRKASEGGALQRLVEQIFKWIRDLIPSLGPIQPGASPGVSRGAQIFVLALCVGVIAFVIWKYWLRHARGPRAVSLREPRVVLGEHLAPDQTAADLLADAERLARSGDLRGAIRKAYVALLCELGDRQVIRLAQHKTNRDYLQAIRTSASPRLYTEMLPLTFNFELHWYGLQQALEHDWTDFHQRCRQVLKSL